MNCEVSIFLRVWCADTLKASALKHADSVGMEAEEFVNEDGSVNVNTCLKVLLDPGSLEGCEVYETTVEGDTNQ